MSINPVEGNLESGSQNLEEICNQHFNSSFDETYARWLSYKDDLSQEDTEYLSIGRDIRSIESEVRKLLALRSALLDRQKTLELDSYSEYLLRLDFEAVYPMPWNVKYE